MGDTKFAGAWLEAAIDAGFVNSNNDRIVLIKSFYQNGDGQFEAKIAAQDYADDWAQLS